MRSPAAYEPAFTAHRRAATFRVKTVALNAAPHNTTLPVADAAEHHTVAIRTKRDKLTNAVQSRTQASARRTQLRGNPASRRCVLSATSLYSSIACGLRRHLRYPRAGACRSGRTTAAGIHDLPVADVDSKAGLTRPQPTRTVAVTLTEWLRCVTTRSCVQYSQPSRPPHVGLTADIGAQMTPGSRSPRANHERLSAAGGPRTCHDSESPEPSAGRHARRATESPVATGSTRASRV
jgi:hypothetical protein